LQQSESRQVRAPEDFLFFAGLPSSLLTVVPSADMTPRQLEQGTLVTTGPSYTEVMVFGSSCP
jgi:hypothetical protein